MGRRQQRPTMLRRPAALTAELKQDGRTQPVGKLLEGTARRHSDGPRSPGPQLPEGPSRHERAAQVACAIAPCEDTMEYGLLNQNGQLGKIPSEACTPGSMRLVEAQPRHQESNVSHTLSDGHAATCCAR